MIKNISVIDMQGNVYEATYPKRARGLVKKGRARFVNESTICLAGPPYKTEDNQMDINEKENEIKTENAQIQESQDGGKVQCLMEILQNIRLIVQDTSYIQTALDKLEDVTDSEAWERIGNIVDAREATNQKAIETLGELANKLV